MIVAVRNAGKGKAQRVVELAGNNKKSPEPGVLFVALIVLSSDYVPGK